MRFEKKMKNRANQKIDNLITTPEFINLDGKKKIKKKFPLWAKIAIPSSLGLTFASVALVFVLSIVLLPLLFGRGSKASNRMPDGGNAQNEDSEYGFKPGADEESSQNEEYENSSLLSIDNIEYSVLDISYENRYIDFINVDLTQPKSLIMGDEVTGLSDDAKEHLSSMGGYSLYHIKGSSSSYIYFASNGKKDIFYIATDLRPLFNKDIKTLLSFFGVDDNPTLQVLSYQKKGNQYSYSKEEYLYNNEETNTIINELDKISSDHKTYLERYKTADRTPRGHLYGMSYELVFSDGVDLIKAKYYSQLASIDMPSIVESSYDIKDSAVYTIMDEQLEMGYTFDYDIYEHA